MIADALPWAVIVAPFIGSFIGVVVVRLPQGQALVAARSVCPACGTRLRARELIPLLSWLVQRGRCRSCGAAIGNFYPIIELAALGIAVWASLLASGWLLWVDCAFGWTLLALAAIDQRHLVLPDVLVAPLVPAGLAVAYLTAPDALLDHALGVAAGFLSFAAVRLVYHRVRGKEGLGWGDAKLLAAAGAWLSWQALPSVVLVSAIAALAAALLARRWRGEALSPSTRVAFGPYLCLGTWLVWLYGPLILSI